MLLSIVTYIRRWIEKPQFHIHFVVRLSQATKCHSSIVMFPFQYFDILLMVNCAHTLHFLVYTLKILVHSFIYLRTLNWTQYIYIYMDVTRSTRMNIVQISFIILTMRVDNIRCGQHFYCCYGSGWGWKYYLFIYFWITLSIV